MNDKQEPKNLKLSIRRKYQRRERDLWHALEQFIIQADERLDPERAGNIHDRETVEKLKSLSEDLFNKMDTPKEFQDDLDFDLIDILKNNNTDQIMNEARRWRGLFSEEELYLFFNNDVEI